MAEGFKGIYSGRRVMLTGHTGFKGSWLSIWLRELGAEVTGFSMDPPTDPSNFVLCRLDARITDLRGDIRDLGSFRKAVHASQPEIIFHLAAQTLVGKSMQDPVETFDTNVLGTVHVLEALRLAAPNPVRVLLFVSSDKCYENRPNHPVYCENDRLGGADPYSASKAMSELVVNSYGKSFFQGERFERHHLALASARSGNVLGGGDFAASRLIPDCIKALEAGEPIKVRNPRSVRPWQFILDPLSGYLWLAACLLEQGTAFSGPWNFGPLEKEGIAVKQIVESMIGLWGTGSWNHVSRPFDFIESSQVRLCRVKSASLLGWRPVYTWGKALEETVFWFKEYGKRRKDGEKVDMYDVCADQIRQYTAEAEASGLRWTS